MPTPEMREKTHKKPQQQIRTKVFTSESEVVRMAAHSREPACLGRTQKPTHLVAGRAAPERRKRRPRTAAGSVCGTRAGRPFERPHPLSRRLGQRNKLARKQPRPAACFHARPPLVQLLRENFRGIEVPFRCCLRAAPRARSGADAAAQRRGLE